MDTNPSRDPRTTALPMRAVAARLAVSRSFAYRLVAPAGPIPSVLVGSRRRVLEADLAAYLESGRQSRKS